MNIQHVQSKLEAKLVQLQERLNNVEKDLSKSHSADSSEQAVERENDEVLQGIAQETQSAIQDIHAALGKIREGTYGRCEDCGEAINPDRLAALPETTHCVSCASD